MCTTAHNPKHNTNHHSKQSRRPKKQPKERPIKFGEYDTPISVNPHYRANISKAIKKEEPERVMGSLDGREIPTNERAEIGEG